MNQLLSIPEIFEQIDEWSQNLQIDTEAYKEKIRRVYQSHLSEEEKKDVLIKLALENIDEANPDWTFLAGRIYLHHLYEQAAKNRHYDPILRYGSFYELIQTLCEKGIYSAKLLEKYTKEEIDYFGQLLKPERDNLFNYLGIYTLATRYLATDYEKQVYELPQERCIIIAIYLMQDEALTNRKIYVE